MYPIGELKKKKKFEDCITIYICEAGYAIKPHKQPEIRMPMSFGIYFTEFMRNPRKLFYLKEGIEYLNFNKYQKEVSLFYKIRHKKEIKNKKDLGEKLETVLLPRKFSIKIFEFGVIFKVEKQDRVFLNKKQIDIMCYYMRNKNLLKTINGIKKVLKQKTIEAI